MDVVGELKREILDSLRASETERAKAYLVLMESIYDATRAIRFPESVLPGFRKKQDVARIQLENAGSDILRFTK
jgi:translin